MPRTDVAAPRLFIAGRCEMMTRRPVLARICAGISSRRENRWIARLKRPTTFDGAVAMLGSLVHDGNLWLGLGTVAAVLVASGILTWVLLTIGRARR